MKRRIPSVEMWLKENRALDPSEAEIVASAITEYTAPLISHIQALEEAMDRRLRQIGRLTIALHNHGLMDEAKEAVRLASEEGNTDG